MVRINILHSFVLLLRGQTIMEMAVVLLLTLPMSVATPVRQRTQTERGAPVNNMQRSGDATLVGSDEDGFSTDTEPASVRLMQVVMSKNRERRAAQKGCKLGTCQVHNLANKLYRIGQSNGKDESHKANDPTGYGR